MHLLLFPWQQDLHVVLLSYSSLQLSVGDSSLEPWVQLDKFTFSFQAILYGDKSISTIGYSVYHRRKPVYIRFVSPHSFPLPTHTHTSTPKFMTTLETTKLMRTGGIGGT